MIDTLHLYIDEAEMYYLKEKICLPFEAVEQRLELTTLRLDLTLARDWLERKKEAYLKAGSSRAAFKKQVWALAAD
ncbi:hypothetical protein BGZ92_002055 [Podila epicladia]|nr:hypothetical protein BGZ92_002055 [Podila epicladia]